MVASSQKDIVARTARDLQSMFVATFGSMAVYYKLVLTKVHAWFIRHAGDEDLEYFLHLESAEVAAKKQASVDELRAILHVLYLGSANLHRLMRAVSGSDSQQIAELGLVFTRSWDKLTQSIALLSPELLHTGVIEPTDPRQPMGVFWAANVVAPLDVANDMDHADNLEAIISAVHFELPDEHTISHPIAPSVTPTPTDEMPPSAAVAVRHQRCIDFVNDRMETGWRALRRVDNGYVSFTPFNPEVRMCAAVLASPLLPVSCGSLGF